MSVAAKQAAPTKGPWRRSPLQAWYVIHGDFPEPICALAEFSEDGQTLHVFPDDDRDQAEANLRLIAAAPDLLEALQSCLACLQMECDECEGCTVDPCTQCRSKAVLRRALGEDSK